MFLRKPEKKSNKSRPSAPFERRVLLSVLCTGLPGAILSNVLLWTNSYSLDHKIEGTAVLLLFWFGLSFSTRDAVVHSIRVLSNVISSLKEEDFSLQASHGVPGDALGDLAIEINDLARSLRGERLGLVEAGNLLNKILSEVDAVIFAFSPEGRVKQSNRAAASFLGKSKENILDRTALELGIGELMEGPRAEIISRPSAGIEKRWIVRRTSFRQNGIPHRLVVLSEASEALRAEERMAWQRLIRVLSHEINNSLAPIKSISRTLGRMLSDQQLPTEIHESFRLGLDVIGSRTEALNRFLQSYAHLAKLPPPTRQTIPLKQLVERVVGLESRLSIAVLPGLAVFIHVDPDQLEQALINLSRNAVEAVLMNPKAKISDSAVTISWAVTGDELALWIRDEGVGLLDSANLFVPFYTTKETGTGIGLLLSRQVAEAHGGRLMIRNREDVGCEVEIKIPACVVEDSISVENDYHLR